MTRVTTILSGLFACVAALSSACADGRSQAVVLHVDRLGGALASLSGPTSRSGSPSLPAAAGALAPAMAAFAPGAAAFAPGAAAFASSAFDLSGPSQPAFGSILGLSSAAFAPPVDLQAQLSTAALAQQTPKIPGLPESETECPAGMVLVDGESCAEVEHQCLEQMKDDPAHRCLAFKPGADKCIQSKGKLRFCMDRYEWPGTPGAQPRVLVDYYEAEKLCKSAGKRMCKEDEFYLACEGPEHWPYAWGHARHPSPCNIDRPYYMVDWQKWAKGGEHIVEEARRLDQALPIGASQCWSPYGVHDIAGNVDEWTTARPGRELQGSLMGGYWGPVQNACRYVTTVHGPEFMFYQIGFRCCAESKS